MTQEGFWQQYREQPLYMKWALFTAVVFCFAVFNYVALTNVSMLLFVIGCAVCMVGVL